MKVTKIAACVILLMFVSGCTLYGVGFENAVMLCPVSLLMLFGLPMVAIIERSIDKELHPEKYLAKKREREARREAIEREFAARHTAEVQPKKQSSSTGTLAGWGCLATLLFFPVAVILELSKKYK